MNGKQEGRAEGEAGSSLANGERTFNQGPELAPTVIKHTLAHVSTSILHAACKLEIFDILHDNGPEMTAGALAEDMGASKINLRRLMNACVRMDLLKAQDTENGEILYSNTEEAEMFLRKQSERSAVPFVNWVNLYEKKFFESLDEAVMKGGPTLNVGDMFGISKKDVSMSLLYDQAMGGKSQTVQHFPHLFDFSRFQTMIDCGGGVGIHAKCMKLAYPTMKVSVLETNQFLNKLKIQGKSLDNQYFNYISGDFFCPLPSADLFLLSHILHNWPDEKYDIILHNIYEALPPGGGLVILEKLYDENKVSRVDLTMDLLMMLAGKGRERTREEHRLMLEKHGFGNVKVWAQVANSLSDVIFALKP